jgi:hypothetical protein
MAAGFCMARSSAEAEGIALNLAREIWPTKDGYTHHAASWLLLNKERSDAAAASFAPRSKRRAK